MVTTKVAGPASKWLRGGDTTNQEKPDEASMMERRKRSAMRKSCLHDLLDQDEAGETASTISGSHHRASVAQEIADRVAQRLASRRPLPPPGKGLLVDYRSME
jgi:hypothetical protein